MKPRIYKSDDDPDNRSLIKSLGPVSSKFLISSQSLEYISVRNSPKTILNQFEIMAKWFTYSLIVTLLLLALVAHNSLVASHKGSHVNINVWRGPSKGHKKHKFAPWGYHAKLPADMDKKKHHHGHYG